jgi:hypothetical protein
LFLGSFNADCIFGNNKAPQSTQSSKIATTRPVKLVPDIQQCQWRHSGAQNKKPRVVRGLKLPQGLLSRFDVFELAGQNTPHHKPPKFLIGTPFKHLGFNSSF